MNKSAFYLSGRRGSGLASMSSFVCMRVCCVEIDRWSNGGGCGVNHIAAGTDWRWNRGKERGLTARGGASVFPVKSLWL